MGFFRDLEWAQVRLSFLAVVIFYNWTEAAFKGLHPIWFVFYIIALEYPYLQLTALQSLESPGFEEDRELVYAEGET